jgi:antibiotic biosynthesis monooxygenase (ABM) superfamily enzyme
VTTLVTVSLMTWVVMPRATRLLHRWLYPTTGDDPAAVN